MRNFRSIGSVLLLVLILGLFFQYNRNDGFLRLAKNTNSPVPAAVLPAVKSSADLYGPREKYLVVYDPEFVHSVLLQRNVAQTFRQLKKDVRVARARDAVEGPLDYRGIILTVENLDKVKSLARFRDYAKNGGTVYVLFRPVPGPAFLALGAEMGCAAADGLTEASGIKLLSNILIKGSGFELHEDALTSSLRVQLAPDAKTHAVSLNGVPMIWERPSGKGKYVVYNGSSLALKQNRGLITGMLALGTDNFVYPVIGAKVVFIDDFPAPFPEGADADIRRDYRMNTAQFFRNIWWPDMLKSAQRYGVRYTGVVIETYDDNTRPPFRPGHDVSLDRNNLVIYGRELIKSGGEIGIHGHNHQPLVPPGYILDGPEYVAWASRADMTASLKEVRRYVEEVYPSYSLQAYVPPSNILSPDGRAAILEALPDTRIIASLYFPDKDSNASYVQEFERARDGVLEMPRVSFGYLRHNNNDWEILNAITAVGVFTHFVHPDNILYTEKRSWKELHKSFDSLLAEIHDRFGWLRGATASQAGAMLEDYLDLDYRLTEERDRLAISCGGFRGTVYFVLRTVRTVKEVRGCEISQIDDNVYLLKISGTSATVVFESGVSP